jgi:membrane dipeptidase
LADHGRNLTDEQAKAIAAAKGLLGVIFYPGYLKNSWRDLLKGTVDDVIRHLDYWLGLVGPDVPAIGSDMNGVMVLKDVRDYSCMPLLAEAVEKRFGEAVARKILFDNALNYVKRVWSRSYLAA